MEADFSLANDAPVLKPAEFANSDRRRQGVLLSGLDCLPGQRDLFPIDGDSSDEDER